MVEPAGQIAVVAHLEGPQQKPVTTREASQTKGTTKSDAAITAVAASAARAAKTRIWPTLRTRRGVSSELSRKPM